MPNKNNPDEPIEVLLSTESESKPVQDEIEDSSNIATGETALTESTHDIPAIILSELKPVLAAVEEKVEALVADAEFWKQLVEKKQEQIDKLHEENRDYKDDLIEQFKRKLVLGIIEQLDASDKQITTFEAKEKSENNYNNLLSAFREVTDDFRDMLQNRFDITPFRSNHGDQFDATRHSVLGRQPSDDKNKDKTISKSKRHGYTNIDGKIIRPELVEVYYFDASLAIPAAVPPVLPPAVDEESMPTTFPVTSSDHEDSETDLQE